MEDDLAFKLFFLTVLILLSGFFSGSEASLFSLSPLHLHRMREENRPFSSYVQWLLRHPRKLLITILVGNEGVNITISVISTSLFISVLGNRGEWPAIIVTTITLLILGEAIPKTFAVTYPMRFSSAVALPLKALSGIVYPVVLILEKIANLISFIFGARGKDREETLTEDEFISLVDEGHRRGALEKEQRDLIHRVFELADTTVSEIMTPRVDIFCLPLSMDPQEMRERIVKKRCSRVPIYTDSRDDIIGVLNSKRLLLDWSDGKAVSIGELLDKPYFVPMEKRADDMLKRFKLKKTQMAIVVDEYGGVSGLVTLHDVLESLVGDIKDEYETREEVFHRIDEGSFIVSGMMSSEDFNDTISNIIPEDFDTVGGFVFHLFGKLPVMGEVMDYEGHCFTIEKISNTRILKIRVTNRGAKND